jgi:signal transduction histidine kinase
MVQMIVEAAGGHIHVESSLGKGTLFRIMLPLATSEPHGKKLLQGN